MRKATSRPLSHAQLMRQWGPSYFEVREGEKACPTCKLRMDVSVSCDERNGRLMNHSCWNCNFETVKVKASVEDVIVEYERNAKRLKPGQVGYLALGKGTSPEIVAAFEAAGYERLDSTTKVES